ncbi:MAG: hypothetical protein C0518_08990, partial [Opitutus sp.]|nr:hypothetical protein [Opitutus sp.]
TDFRFKMRVWFLKQTPSICTESSVGANTEVWSREGVIYRLTPRANDAVNDNWMTDSGRMLYKQVRADDRLLHATINGTTSTPDMAVKAAADLLRAGAVAVVGSGRSSVEEQFLTKKLATALKATVALVSRVGKGDGILLSADRNPNVRGALVTGLISALPSQQLTSLPTDIDAGKVKTVVAINEDLSAAGLSAAQLAKVSIIYLGTHRNATSDAAKVVLPTLTVFEKAGTFVNQQFRIQKFAKAVPGPDAVADDLVTLANLVAAVGGASVPAEVTGVWAAMAAEIPALAALSYAKISAAGTLLDSAAWAGLPFVEGETLHFKPAAPKRAKATVTFHKCVQDVQDMGTPEGKDDRMVSRLFFTLQIGDKTYSDMQVEIRQPHGFNFAKPEDHPIEVSRPTGSYKGATHHESFAMAAEAYYRSFVSVGDKPAAIVIQGGDSIRMRNNKMIKDAAFEIEIPDVGGAW